MKSLTRVLTLLVQLLRLAFCVILIYAAATDGTNGEASKSWPTVKGELTTADVKQLTSKGDTKYEANVQYSYEVNERAFTSDRVQFGGLAFRDPSKIVQQLKTTKELIVHYKPDQPEVACLETGSNLYVILAELAGALLMVVLAVADHLKHKRKIVSEASSEGTPNKISSKPMIFILVLVGFLIAALQLIDNVNIAGIPPKVLSVCVLFFGGLSIVLLLSLIAPCVGFCIRRGYLELAEMLANLNAAIFGAFPSSFELALAHGLQAEVAQERLQYKKALSLSKKALNVMAERRKVLNAVRAENIGVLEEHSMNLSQKQFSSLESVCNESLGCICFEMGNYDDAMRYAKAAVRMAEILMNDPPSDNLATKLALACALALKGRIENKLGCLDDAKADLKRALSIRQEAKFPYPDRLAIIMAHLASTYSMQSEYRTAEKLIDEGLKIVEGSHERDMELARAALQLQRAETKMLIGQYGNAEELLDECISIREKLLLPNHPHIAEAYLASANLSQLRGKSNDAARQRERASSILKYCFGVNHPLDPGSDMTKGASFPLAQRGIHTT
ncbi:MAG: tetratricopeptide repeat protein [Cyanobacteria bacterium SZAS-4]|nr:tetratricopeptide repeat protein [Cyanobacteria bacterium SZAS-4]